MLSQAVSCPQGTSTTHERHVGFCLGYPMAFIFQRLGLDLPNWIASCLLLKGLCIPLSINLFMALG